MKKQRIDWTQFGWPILILVIFLIAYLIVGTTWAGNFSLKVKLSPVVWIPDSCRVEVRYADWTLVDSGTIGPGGWPDSLTVTVDSLKGPCIYPYYYWYASDSASLYPEDVSCVGAQLVSASASVDYAQAADSVDSVLSRAHGYGSWEGAGSGVYTVDYHVLDTLGGATTGVWKATVVFRAWGGTSTHRSVTTNASGVARISTDEDSLMALVYAPLYEFPTSWDSMTWSADYVDSIHGYLNQPAASPAATYVNAYIDVGTGQIDSAAGTMIPRTQMQLILDLIGEPRLNDGSWSIVPKRQKKAPDATGRAQFPIPTNDALVPAGSYYILSYRAFDGESWVTGEIKRFVVDSLTDPINILNATEVWR